MSSDLEKCELNGAQNLINIWNNLFPFKNKISVKEPRECRHDKSIYADKLRNGTLNREMLENWKEDV